MRVSYKHNASLPRMVGVLPTVRLYMVRRTTVAARHAVLMSGTQRTNLHLQHVSRQHNAISITTQRRPQIACNKQLESTHEIQTSLSRHLLNVNRTQ